MTSVPDTPAELAHAARLCGLAGQELSGLQATRGSEEAPGPWGGLRWPSGGGGGEPDAGGAGRELGPGEAGSLRGL